MLSPFTDMIDKKKGSFEIVNETLLTSYTQNVFLYFSFTKTKKRNHFPYVWSEQFY